MADGAGAHGRWGWRAHGGVVVGRRMLAWRRNRLVRILSRGGGGLEVLLVGVGWISTWSDISVSLSSFSACFVEVEAETRADGESGEKKETYSG